MKSNKKFVILLEILVITFLVMSVVPVCGQSDFGSPDVHQKGFSFYAVYDRLADTESLEGQIWRSAMSGDGSRLIFSTYTDMLYTINADGSDLTSIPFPTDFGSIGMVTINKDGSRAFFAEPSFIYKVEGGVATQILDTNDHSEIGRCKGIETTAGGDYVYFTEDRGSDLWRIRHDGGIPEKVIEDTEVPRVESQSQGRNVKDFTISADGSTIAFVLTGRADPSKYLYGTKEEIFVLDDDGYRQLTNDDKNVYKSHIDISGDGTTIVFSASSPQNKWYSIRSDGSAKIALGDYSFNVAGPVLNYDGTRMFYNDAGAHGGRLVNTDGSGGIDLFPPWNAGAIMIAATFDPCISNDGRRVSFRYISGGGPLYVGYLNDPEAVPDSPTIHNIVFNPPAMPRGDPDARVILTSEISDPQGLADIEHTSIKGLVDGCLESSSYVPVYFLGDYANDRGYSSDETAGDGIFSGTGKPGGKIDELDQMTVRMGAMDASKTVVIADTVLFIGGVPQTPTPTPTPTPTTPPPISFCETVDNTALSWTTDGDADWFGQEDTYYYDGDAAECGDIGDDEESCIQTSVSGPGTLSFYWMVSSEEGHDYLRFYVDDIQQDSISGSTSWTQKTYSIDSGTHSLKWCYTKDDSGSSGEDCGWLDKVEFSAGPKPPLATTQVPIDRTGSRTTPTINVNRVDYALVGVMSVNSSDSPPDAAGFELPQEITVDLEELGMDYVETVYLATQTAWSFDLPNDVKVATLVCEYAEGGPPTTLDLIMGVNTAEWAYENPHHTAAGGPPPHSMPPVITSTPTTIDSDEEYNGHTYAASVSLDPTRTLSSLRLELVDANQLLGYRSPLNPVPTWLGQACMAVTLEGRAATQEPRLDELPEFIFGNLETFDFDNDGSEDRIVYTFEPEEVAEDLFLDRSVEFDKTESGFGGKIILRFENKGDKTIEYTHIEEIPKSFAESVDDLVFSVPPDEIIDPDPIVSFVAKVKKRTIESIKIEAILEEAAASFVLDVLDDIIFIQRLDVCGKIGEESGQMWNTCIVNLMLAFPDKFEESDCEHIDKYSSALFFYTRSYVLLIRGELAYAACKAVMTDDWGACHDNSQSWEEVDLCKTIAFDSFIQKCRYIKDSQKKDECFYDAAVRADCSKGCGYISEQVSKNACLAEITQDKKYCKNIKDEDARRFCCDKLTDEGLRKECFGQEEEEEEEVTTTPSTAPTITIPSGVHHLGDQTLTDWEVQSPEGTEYTTTFSLATEPARAYLILEVFQTDYDNPVLVNGKKVGFLCINRYKSWEQCTISIPKSALNKIGSNTLTIRAGRIGTNYDDFMIRP